MKSQIISLESCEEFIAGDKTILREMIHASKASWALNYSLAHARLEPGTQSYEHTLKSSEVYFVIEGEGLMHLDEDVYPVKAGDTVYIAPHTKQFIQNTGQGQLAFLCIVEPAWRAEDEVVDL